MIKKKKKILKILKELFLIQNKLNKKLKLMLNKMPVFHQKKITKIDVIIIIFKKFNFLIFE